VNRAGKKRKARIVSFRIDEDDFTLLDALARQTSCSRGEVLRRRLASAQKHRNSDPQAEAGYPTIGDSEDLVSWHLAPFRRAPQRDARAIRVVQQGERECVRAGEEREL
jgi:hypothetical protein